MPQDTTVIRAAIHPAIGIARVGNSEQSFIGPEVPHPRPAKPGYYKDTKGALKRQAALFRVYGYNAAGEVVTELTADNSAIEWTVHVANSKAAWYQFQRAMDLPPEELTDAAPAFRRNTHVTGANRNSLVIDPGPRSIRGCDESGEAYHLIGKFFDQTVYLGELRTDRGGRLTFLGGRGVSRSATGQPPTDFANNDNWHDDVSDGPVTARVSIDGREVPVDGAWVVVGPPNYAPALKSIRTLYDLLYDRYVGAGWLPEPNRVSFSRHVAPVFERLCGLQWVNAGFAAQFGRGAADEFLRTDLLARLADASDSNKEFRRLVFLHFREYEKNNSWRGFWPWIYGDAMDRPEFKHSYLALGTLQLRWLERWARGDFEEDYDPGAPPPTGLDDVELEKRPALLDEAALTFCLADAFHPGCELTWVLRSLRLYRAPFRVRRRPENQPEPDFGDILTPSVAVSSDGPLTGSGPGDLTRWMAVPWQTDTASCLSGYSFSQLTPYTPTFWPARVPNQVLSEHHYKIARDANRPRAERVEAFRTREDWYRGFQSRSYLDDIAQMITDFGKLGVIEVRDGVPGDPDLPAQMLVESEPGLLLPPPLPIGNGLPVNNSHAAKYPVPNPRQRSAEVPAEQTARANNVD